MTITTEPVQDLEGVMDKIEREGFTSVEFSLLKNHPEAVARILLDRLRYNVEKLDRYLRAFDITPEVFLKLDIPDQLRRTYAPVLHPTEQTLAQKGIGDQFAAACQYARKHSRLDDALGALRLGIAEKDEDGKLLRAKLIPIEGMTIVELERPVTLHGNYVNRPVMRRIEARAGGTEFVPVKVILGVGTNLIGSGRPLWKWGGDSVAYAVLVEPNHVYEDPEFTALVDKAA